MIQAAGAVVVVPLMLKAVGPKGFGVWGAATSLAWLIAMLDLGLGAALVTMVARETAVNRSPDARRHVTGALVGAALLGVATLVVSLVIVFVAVPHDLRGPYLIAVVGVAVNVPLNGVNCVWLALQKGYVSSLWETFQTGAILAGLALASFVTSRVPIFVAVVYGSFVLANLGSFIHLLIAHPELRPDLHNRPWRATRAVAGKGLMYFLAALAGGFTYLFDNVLALQLLGPEASARMTVAARICLAAGGVLTIISQPFWPAFTDAAARGDLRWIRRNLIWGSLMVLGVGSAGAACIVTLGGPLLRWWLRVDLGIDQGLLWAIAAWIVVQASGRVSCFLLFAVGVVRYQVVMCAVSTTIAFCLKFLWAPQLGVAGILWASAVTGFFINMICLTWRCHSWLRSTAERAATLP